LTTMPVAAPAGSLSSAWFCAGATAAGDGPASGTIVIANAAATPVTGTVTVVPASGAPRAVPITVAARGRAAVRQPDVVDAAHVAALVEMNGGEVVVEQVVSGPLGDDVAPCAVRGSPTWHLAAGSTARDDTLLAYLYNPFAEAAIADLQFSTDQGHAAPADLQGVVVKERSLVVVNVGDHVRRRDAVSTTVQTRSGRLVVARLQLRSGTTRGLTLALGAPSAGTVWYFPEGVVVDGVRERFHLYNPSGREASVDVELALEEGAAEPFELALPAGGRLTLALDEETRVPPGVAHATTVTVLNDVGVVVERSIEAAAPSGRSGLADTLGARRGAERWLLAAGGTSEALDQWVVVQNIGGSEVTYSLTGLAGGQALAIEGAQQLTVAAGGRRSFRLGDHIKRADLPVLVTASGLVVAERDLYRVGGRGLSAVIGTPLR
ncbi:MAG: DUF5719 family protein, partial [Acidimicrobiales bacterium]